MQRRPILARCAFLVFAAIFAFVSQAPAQTTPRYALVVGEASYNGDVLQTVTADAAVVAQALRDQGFDVTELHDLATADLGNAWQAFTTKLATAPIGATAAVYLSGLAVQYNCDDYLLPIDAQITQASDVAGIGLSMMRVLSDMSHTRTGARIVLLDGAREIPASVSSVAFPKGLIALPAPAATSFGLSEEVHDIVPTPQPDDVNGPYALAVANISRQPLADLDAFLREVRIQTHHLSAGAQTPWHATGSFMPVVVLDVTADEAQIENASLTLPSATTPLSGLTAEDAYWSALWRNTIAGYNEFLTSFTASAPPDQVERIRELLADLQQGDPQCAQHAARPAPAPAPYVLPPHPAAQVVDVCPQGFRPRGGYDGSQCEPIAALAAPPAALSCPLGFSSRRGDAGFYCQKDGPQPPQCPPGNHPQWNGEIWLCVASPAPPPPNVCPPGSFAKWNGFQWTCEAEANVPPVGGGCPPGRVPGPGGVCVAILVPPPGARCPPGQVQLPNMPAGTCTVLPPNAGDCPLGSIKLQNGICVPKSANTCPAGQVMVNGACTSTAGACSAGTTMSPDGVCVQDPSKPCPPGETRVDGRCVTGGVVCAAPMVRTADGFCEVRGPCPAGETKVNGRCITGGVACLSGFKVNEAGFCVPDPTQKCPAGTTRDPSGACRPVATAGAGGSAGSGGTAGAGGTAGSGGIPPAVCTGSGGTMSSDGVCVQDPSKPCPSGQTRVNGVCQTGGVGCVAPMVKTADGFCETPGPCPLGQVKVKGKCGFDHLVCSPGLKVNEAGFCVPDPTAQCPAGQKHSPDGGCTSAATATLAGPAQLLQGSACPPGQTKSANGACVAVIGPGQPCQTRLPNGACVSTTPATGPGQTCAPGQGRLPDGTCVGTPTSTALGQTCPPGETRRPSGICVTSATQPAAGSCLPGEARLANGACVMGSGPPTGVGGSCPPGETRQPNGSCLASTTPSSGAAGQTCPPGETRLPNGACVGGNATSTGAAGQSCSPGETRQPNGTCMATTARPNGTAGQTCPPGENRLPNGACVGGNGPPTGTAAQSCPPGETRQPNGSCVATTARPSGTAGQTCPPGETRGSNGACVAVVAPPMQTSRPPTSTTQMPSGQTPSGQTSSRQTPAVVQTPKVQQPPGVQQSVGASSRVLSLPTLPSGLAHLASPPVPMAPRPQAPTNTPPHQPTNDKR